MGVTKKSALPFRVILSYTILSIARKFLVLVTAKATRALNSIRQLADEGRSLRPPHALANLQQLVYAHLNFTQIVLITDFRPLTITLTSIGIYGCGKLNTGIWQGIYLCEHRNQVEAARL
ncbi:MAG TPA: hypothetical protein VK625_18380 [Flavitalea sp.]|nr:hypothetical protein [Flavitalea sp.]